MTDKHMLWRRLDQPSHEAAHLSFADSVWRLCGAAIFAHDAHACHMDYDIVCDAAWQTRSGWVQGWVGQQRVAVDMVVDASGRWWLSGDEIPTVAGCIDLDLNFSPSTNLLPIRRLQLAIGQAAEVQAAWLRFPSFTLEPLRQVYHQLNEATYRYASAGGSYVAELQVYPNGFVTSYPQLWQLEVGS